VPTAYLKAKTERRTMMVLCTHEISKLLRNACKVCLFAPLNHDVEKIVSPVGFGMCVLRGGESCNCTLSAQCQF